LLIIFLIKGHLVLCCNSKQINKDDMQNNLHITSSLARQKRIVAFSLKYESMLGKQLQQHTQQFAYNYQDNKIILTCIIAYSFKAYYKTLVVAVLYTHTFISVKFAWTIIRQGYQVNQEYVHERGDV